MPVDITIEPGVALNSIDDDDKLPYNHVISVVDREISIDVPELVQNNVATDTYTLDLDGEWDGISPVVIFGPCESAVEVAYTNGPTTIPADVTKAYGPVDVSVVGYDSTGTVRIVTIAAPKAMNVLESGCYTGTTTEDPDPSLIGQIVAAGDAANKAAEAANTAAGNANEKAQYATESGELAVEKAGVADASAANADAKATLATDAASSANTAANEARQVIAQLPLPDGNVPKRTLGPDAVLTTDDAFSAVPLGLKVYGNTRQNLWANPSGSDAGVTVTANEDGSITLSGTATANVFIYLSSYVFSPGSTHCLSCGGTIQNGVGFYIEHAADSHVGLNHDINKRMFTTKSSFDVPPIFGISVASGTTVSGTYRIMLNEGSTAEPWCPPGLNGVDELGVVCAGKNLLARMGSKLPYTNAGITFSDNGDGGIRVSGTATTSAYYNFFDASTKQAPRIAPGEYTASSIGGDGSLNLGVGYFNGEIGADFTGSWIATNASGIPRTNSIDRPVYVRAFLSVASGKAVDTVVYPQLELGSTATDYEPPNVTIIPIDLQGNELCSLPDGTRDELNVVTGTITKSVGYIESYSGEDVGEDYIASALTDSGEIANGAQVVYKLSDPQTIQFTPPELPALPSPNVTAYASANVEAESEMEYIRDVNVVLGKLESAAQAL